jgi:hypothetical protein
MLFFDFALMTIAGAAGVALIVAMLALITGFIGRERSALHEADCRDTRMILHGEGSRDCE